MKILVINLGWEQEPLIRKLGDKGYELYGVHLDETYEKYVDYKDVLICDFREVTKIYEFAKRVGIEGVISDNCDYSLMAQAFIADRLNLVAPSLKAAQIANNKYLQRTIVETLGVKNPKFRLCLDKNDVMDFAKENGFPIITKPVDNRGSFGVKKINSLEEIDEAFEYAFLNSNSNLVIAEEFIVGQQVTIDGYGFSKSGVRSLTIGDKILVDEDGEVARSPIPLGSYLYAQAKN